MKLYKHFEKNNIWPHLLLGAYGAGFAIRLDLVGKIYSGELLALIFLPFVGIGIVYKKSDTIRKLYLSYAVLLAGLTISNIYNETDLKDAVRGLASPIFSLIGVSFFAPLLAKRPTAFITFLVVTFLVKYFIGDVGSLEDTNDQFAELNYSSEFMSETDNYFKVRIVPFLIPAVAVISCFIIKYGGKYGQNLSIALFGITTVLCGIFEARSVALVFFITAFIMFFINSGIKLDLRKILIPFVLSTLPAYAAYASYINYALNAGGKGHSLVQLEKLNNPYNPLELLLIGRSELLVLPDIVIERPIFGYGSWAIDEGYKFNSLRMQRSEGNINTLGASERDYIPAHSSFTMAWIWGGIIGFFGSILIFKVMIKSIWSSISYKNVIIPAVILYYMLGVWDFCFSPLMSIRFSMPITMGLSIALNIRQDNQNRVKQNIAGL